MIHHFYLPIVGVVASTTGNLSIIVILLIIETSSMICNQLLFVYCSLVSVTHGSVTNVEAVIIQHSEPPTKTSVFVATGTMSMLCIQFHRYTFHLLQGRWQPLFEGVLWAHPSVDFSP